MRVNKSCYNTSVLYSSYDLELESTLVRSSRRILILLLTLTVGFVAINRGIWFSNIRLVVLLVLMLLDNLAHCIFILSRHSYSDRISSLLTRMTLEEQNKFLKQHKEISIKNNYYKIYGKKCWR